MNLPRSVIYITTLRRRTSSKNASAAPPLSATVQRLLLSLLVGPAMLMSLLVGPTHAPSKNMKDGIKTKCSYSNTNSRLNNPILV